MNKVIWVVIGLVFAVLAYMVIIQSVHETLMTREAPEIIMNASETLSDSLRITWKTDVNTDGRVYYTVGGKESFMMENELQKSHSITLEHLSGTVEYSIESCDPEGNCVTSEIMTSVLSAVSCGSVLNGECDVTKPKYCDDGDLVDDCWKCGCDPGLACISNGSCVIPPVPP